MLHDGFLIGRQIVTRPEAFFATDPSTNAPLQGKFSISTQDDVAEACSLAEAAFDSYRDTPPDCRATFLEAVATNLEARGDALIARAMAETGLPQARLTGELGRTTGQLRLFARVVREGRWADLTFDRPLPDRQPAPRPDLRQRRIALGPVAVFGASNFPLAFSVAGGDTASALAAGCPVVVKAHPAHPGASLIAAEAISDAVARCKLPEGVFSLVQGPANALGAALVADARIKAVGFTGSRAGGLALVAIAQARAEPIPVYAEMSSVNPVILMPAALAARPEALAKGFVGSLTMGAGQFCTNPGIIFAVAGPDLERFVAAAVDELEAVQPQVMLTGSIYDAYERGVAILGADKAVMSAGYGVAASGCNRGRAAIFVTDAKNFIVDPALAHEVFGAASIIVRCESVDQIRECLAIMEGQLTATIHLDPPDINAARPLIPLLERKAGRILANGWPTGVEVSYAMVHGGPYPATSDPRSTSVGAAAIERFLRPICYQSLPDSLLPDPLKDGNPWSFPRRDIA